MTYPIERPPFDARAVFMHCISDRISNENRELLSGYADQIAKSENAFDESMRCGNAHTLRSTDFRLGSGVGNDPLDKIDDELGKVYTARLAKKDSMGRFYYDEILKSADKCPSCGHLAAREIDHFVPKDKFQLLAVCPLNLVPICRDCNRRKMNKQWTTPGSVPLHPYYDRIHSDRWLVGIVEESIPATVTYVAVAPGSWPIELGQRLASHFEFFELNQLYAAQAVDELAVLKGELTELFELYGTSEVVATLERRLRGCEKQATNSWRTALFRALSQNQWYCNGGFA